MSAHAPDRPRTSTPAGHLAARGPRARPLLFLYGAVSTQAGTDEVVCRLESHGFVWTGCFAGIHEENTQ